MSEEDFVFNKWEDILDEYGIPYKFEVETPCNKCRRAMEHGGGLLNEETAVVTGWQLEPYDYEGGRLTAFIDAFRKFRPNCNLKAHVLSYESGCTVTKVICLTAKNK